MFSGATPLSVDAKGRIAMPARYRQGLMDSCAGKLLVTVHPDRCLQIYPQDTWLEYVQQLRSLPAGKEAARRLVRFLVGYATEVDMDRQGRLLIAPVLREWAGLDRRAMLVGQINRFEIWDEEVWNGQYAKPDEDAFDLLQGLDDLTL